MIISEARNAQITFTKNPPVKMNGFQQQKKNIDI